MNDKKPINLTSLYIILAITGSSLIITGCFLGIILDIFSLNINKNIVYCLQAIFIISGLADFWLIKYANSKLS